MQVITFTEGGVGTDIRKTIFYLTNVLLIRNTEPVVFDNILPIYFMIVYNTTWCLTGNLQVFIWILHTNINMLRPFFPAFTHPSDNNGAVFKQ